MHRRTGNQHGKHHRRSSAGPVTNILICSDQVYTKNISDIYLAYTTDICKKYIPGIYLAYTRYMTIQKVIYLVYSHDILNINLAYDHLCHIPGLYLEKTLWVCSVPVTYPDSHVIYQAYAWYITWPIGYVTGTEQTHKVFSRFIPGI